MGGRPPSDYDEDELDKIADRLVDLAGRLRKQVLLDRRRARVGVRVG
jgi:hypothetical protein